MSVQDIKDTFYTTLRDRIAAANAARTTVVRGTTRPAVMVAENELPGSAATPDAFTLSWSALDLDPLGMAKLSCALRYTTAGSTGAGGMDRGRALAAMDAELRAALTAEPQWMPLLSFAEANGVATTTGAGTSIFWTSPAFAPVVTRNELLERSASVEVFGYA